MTKIPYTYEIVAVHQGSMDVRYQNPTHGEVTVGVRIPFEGEELAYVIEQFSPAIFWAEQTRPKATVVVGESGSGETQVAPEFTELTEEERLEIWRSQAVISQLQAHYTLKVWGIYDQIYNLVQSVGDPLAMAFDRAIEWRRSSPTITAMFSNITLPDGSAPTPEVVDQFFVEAGSFEV